MEKRDESDEATVAAEAQEGLVLVKESPLLLEATPAGLTTPVTVAPFVRSHFEVPALGTGHRVRILGAVDKPLSIGVPELLALAQREVVMTLECAGNGRLGMTPLPGGEPWGYGAVATVVWTGVPLSELLERAGVAPDAVEVRAEGADAGLPEGATHSASYARALPLEKAMQPDTLVALEMNGQPIPIEHGAPVRLIVPGWYGMASVKWLTRLEVRTIPFEGWFQSDRYIYDYADDLPPEPVNELRPRSTLVTPADGARLARGTVQVRGWAWSAVEVERVELSVDGGPWKEATLGAPLGPYAWRAFELAWKADRSGRHTLRTRATDARGAAQPDWARFNRLGYGANAIQTVVVEVI